MCGKKLAYYKNIRALICLELVIPKFKHLFKHYLYLNVHLKNGILLIKCKPYRIIICENFTLASIQWNEFFIKWYNKTKTVIEITTSLKKLYPPNYVFKEREIRAWRTMLNHAECTNVTPSTKDISPVSYFIKEMNFK